MAPIFFSCQHFNFVTLLGHHAIVMDNVSNTISTLKALTAYIQGHT